MAMTSAGVFGQRRHPGDEAALERLGVERGENVAEMIMRRRAVRERPEPAQQLELLLAEPRDVGERLRAGQNRQQAQEQDLIERIDHLAGWPMIRHVFEIPEKNSRLGKRLAIRASACPSPLPRQISGLRQIQPFNPLSPTSSPDCPPTPGKLFPPRRKVG